MSLGHEHGLVLIGLAGPMDVVNLSLSLSLSQLPCRLSKADWLSPLFSLLQSVCAIGNEHRPYWRTRNMPICMMAAGAPCALSDGIMIMRQIVTAWQLSLKCKRHEHGLIQCQQD